LVTGFFFVRFGEDFAQVGKDKMFGAENNGIRHWLGSLEERMVAA
jgi:hypothetical protein